MLETQATPLEEQGWAEAFKAYFSLFASLFARSESRGKAEAYLRGLFSELPRKNCWHLAERLGFKSPLRLQRLLNDDPWSDDMMMRSARTYIKTIIEEATESNEGIAVVDESGFVKKGEQSAGVQRQYCGRFGPWRAKDRELSGRRLPRLGHAHPTNLPRPASVPAQSLVRG